MRVSDAMALVTVDVGKGSAAAGALRGLAAAFRAAGLPVVHAVEDDTVVLGGPVPSPPVRASIIAAELRGYRVLLATDELAVTLGAHLTAA